MPFLVSGFAVLGLDKVGEDCVATRGYEAMSVLFGSGHVMY